MQSIACKGIDSDSEWQMSFFTTIAFPLGKWRYFIGWFAPNGLVPVGIEFVFVNRQPCGDETHLPCWERSGEQFAIDANRCLMLCVINVDMWLVVLFVIDIQHFDYDIEKTG